MKRKILALFQKPDALVLRILEQKLLNGHIKKICSHSFNRSIFYPTSFDGFRNERTNFAFIGYLPKEKADRRRKIKQIEQYSKTHKQTQIFIETPFRNNHLLDDLQKYCYADTQIIVACDLTLPTQYIKRLSAKDWKNKS